MEVPSPDDPQSYQDGHDDSHHYQDGRNTPRLIQRGSLLNENLVGPLRVNGISNVNANRGFRRRVEQHATGPVAVDTGLRQRIDD